MIYELTVRSSKLSPVRHWDKVAWLKGQKKIEFKPGINVIYGVNGCLASDTFVSYAIRTPEGKHQNGKGGTIERLYHRFHGIQMPGRGAWIRKQTVESWFYAPSIDEKGRIFVNRILDVVKTGDKPCIAISTEWGTIEATNDHKFWTGEKFVRASDLSVGDIVHVHNMTRHRKAEKDKAHHKDENCRNDKLENLEVVDSSEHIGLHSRERKAGLFFSSIPAVITHIAPAGIRSTYDLKMMAPHNNYVANGFVVHNSGKSTLISALAMLQHCYASNWPRVDKTSVSYFMSATGRFLDGLILEHDGEPCRYLGVEAPDTPPTSVAIQAVEIENKREATGQALFNMSHGQATLNKFIRFVKAKPTKVVYVLKEKNITPAWRGWYEAATESLKNAAHRSGMPRQQTIILDEVDRSLDFTKQASVWKEIRLLAEAGFQIIIASHSPWAAVQPNAHYIETTPGYLDKTRRALGVLLQNLGDEASSQRRAERSHLS